MVIGFQSTFYHMRVHLEIAKKLLKIHKWHKELDFSKSNTI